MTAWYGVAWDSLSRQAVVESLRQTAVAAMSREVARRTVSAAMQRSARLLIGSGVSAHVLTLTQGVLRTMWWNKLRFLAVATLAVGIASVGTGVYVSGSQDPAPNEGQPGSKQPPSQTTKTPRPDSSLQAGPPAAGSPQADCWRSNWPHEKPEPSPRSPGGPASWPRSPSRSMKR